MISLLLCSWVFIIKAQSIPTPEEYLLDNGLKVIVIPFGQLKTMSATLYVNCGKKNETPGQELFADLAAKCVVLGNTNYNKTQLKDALFRMGTSLDVDVNENYTTIESSFIEKDFSEGLKLMASCVMSPLFNESDLKQYINQVLDYNNPMKMDILQQAALFSNVWVYGNQNPIGRFYKSEMLKKVSVDAIKEFYQFNYTPKNSRLVLCGNFDKEQVKNGVKENFGKWKAAYGEVNGVRFESPQMKSKEYGFVSRAHAEQAALQWNKNGPAPGSKEEMAFMLANEIFNNILFKEIREKGGKTYGINSRYNPYSGSSIYTVVTQVRNDEVLNTIQLFDITLKMFYDKGITDADLKIAKKNMSNRWLKIESPDDVISFFNPLIYAKPALRKNYIAEVDVVKLDDVNKVIKKYYTPDSYKLLISGNEQALNAQLQKLTPLRRFTMKDLEM